MKFLDKMKEQARKEKKRIVLPEGTEERTLKATEQILDEGIADISLIGYRDEILQKSPNIEAKGATIVDHIDDPEFKNFVDAFYELRKHKNISKGDAAKIMSDPMYYGVMMVKKELADGMVAGAIHSTADTLRPALQILKTAKESRMASSFFILDVPNSPYGHEGVVVMSDCGLIEDPSDVELSEIAMATAKSTRSFLGIDPKVAMLSYSTKGSASSPVVEKVQSAVSIIKGREPDFEVDGELQLDAAIVPEVAKIKAPDSNVAGNANVLIFPDINAGNIGYKLVQRFAKADAYGPILQGIAKPVNDLSRGSTVDDIVGTVTLTAVQAQI